jgi:predicted dehydrogenase
VIRWGVAGPGGIATGFAEAMRLEEGGEIVAVASRSMERADAFADRFGVARRYDDYDALAADAGVDAVYVATPHSRHEADTLAFLAGGKHVLCEKPMALNAAQVRRMVDAARQRRLFLMEAIWSRFLPSYRVLGDVLRSGRIGEPVLVEADFGFQMPFDPSHRLFDPAQGGGALLDLGIYPIQLCTLVLGPAERVVADGVLGETGVDEVVAAVLHHGDGKLGVIKAAVRANLSCTARIAGTEGTIEIPAFMHTPMDLTVLAGGHRETIDATHEHGLRFEIAEVHRCLAAGLLESPDITLDESIALATVMDDIRGQLGVVYPGE